MKKTSVVIALSFLMCMLVPASAFAEEKEALEARVGVGLIVINSGNNLNPNGSKSFLSDLDSAADKESSTLPIILPDITYDVGAPNGLKLYLNMEPPIDEVGGFAINLGGSYQYEGIGIVDISAFLTPFEEAWKNPYAVGTNRQSTSTSKYGAKIAFNKIMGTGLRTNLVYMKDYVDDDEIGDIMPELQQSGAVYAFNVNYSFYPSKSLEIRPRMGIRKGVYDGESNSFIKYKVDLEARYKNGRFMVIPRVYYSHSEYDETNPIFEKTRKNDGYGANVMANYFAPFGFSDWSVAGIINYSIGESNITFYDTEAMSVGALLNYHF